MWTKVYALAGIVAALAFAGPAEAQSMTGVGLVGEARTTRGGAAAGAPLVPSARLPSSVVNPVTAQPPVATSYPGRNTAPTWVWPADLQAPLTVGPARPVGGLVRPLPAGPLVLPGAGAATAGPPPMYSAGYSAPTPPGLIPSTFTTGTFPVTPSVGSGFRPNPYTAGRNLSNPYTAGLSGVNPYSAGKNSPNPYTAGVPNAWQGPTNQQFGIPTFPTTSVPPRVGGVPVRPLGTGPRVPVKR